jgi:hypothetical protein
MALAKYGFHSQTSDSPGLIFQIVIQNKGICKLTLWPFNGTEFIFIGIIPYLEIEASACRNSTEDSRLILMVDPNGDRSRNRSSGYPTIGRSETSDVQTPIVGLVRNLNPDFNVVRVQMIIETIQRMTPDGSPLALLAQQGAEAVNIVVAEKSVGVSQREPYVSHNDRARRARSEVASSGSPNRYLAENDAR